MDASLLNNPSAKGQHLVTVVEWGNDPLDYWAQHSGGEVTAEANPVWNGGALRADYIAGRAETSNITVIKPYYPGRDVDRLRRFLDRVGRLRTTVVLQDTDPDLVGGVYGPPMVYPNALLVRVKPPESEAGSSDADTIELEFTVPGMAPS